MQLSVIILNYNVRYFLELCVLSVQEALHTIDSEIIVVDNHSSDDSCEMILRQFPNVKLIQNKKNLGFPKGNNIGVAEAKGKYICILNPDTVVAEDTFVKILAFAEKQKNIGVVGCQLIDGTGNFLPESKRQVPTPWVAFTKVSGLYKLFPKSNYFNQYYAQHLNENQTGEVAILVGAFMFLKRKIFQELQGFDEACFMYADDIDLSYRILKKGYKNYYFSETTVIHYKGESTLKNEKYMKRFQEAMKFFYKKHFKVSILFSVFIKTGIVFFSIMKMFQGKKIHTQQPESYILYSSNEDLALKLISIYQKKVTIFNQEAEKIVNSSHKNLKRRTEYLLDNHYISYQKCIEILKTHKRKGVTFKILPKNKNYLIGSDSSYDKGEILEIE